MYTGFNFLTALNLPANVYNMIPYIISLVVLMLTSKNSRVPKAEGIPYDKSTRSLVLADGRKIVRFLHL